MSGSICFSDYPFQFFAHNNTDINFLLHIIMAAADTIVPPPPSDPDARTSESTANDGIMTDDDDDNAIVEDEEDLFGGKNDDDDAAAVDAAAMATARSTLLLRDNPPPPPLPPGWHLIPSRSAPDYHYYFHRDTGECRWEYPSSTSTSSSSSRAAAANDANDEVGGILRSGEGGAEGEMDVVGADSTIGDGGIASSSSSSAAVRGILKRSMSSSDHPPVHRATSPENGDGTAVVEASSLSSSSRQHSHSSTSQKRARADHRREGVGGGGVGDASSSADAAEPREVRCLHILRKHRDSKRPSSWRVAKVTCTKERAISDIRELMAILEGAANSDDGNELRATFEELARTESDCSSAKRGGDLGFFGRKKMNAAFEKASFRLRVGEMSDVVDTSSGVHVILRIA